MPCGADSISTKIYENELAKQDSFSKKYYNLLQSFDYKVSNSHFFDELVEKVILSTREKLDIIFEEIVDNLNSKHWSIDQKNWFYYFIHIKSNCLIVINGIGYFI